MRRRLGLELAAALAFGVATIATLIWPTWIESLTSLEPDQGSGESEWWLVVVLGAISLTAFLLSFRTAVALRRESRLPPASGQAT